MHLHPELHRQISRETVSGRIAEADAHRRGRGRGERRPVTPILRRLPSQHGRLAHEAGGGAPS